METVRLNITLPKETAEKLEILAGPKGKSSFIAECLKQSIAHLEKEKLKDLLAEGYQNTKAEGLALAKEFEAADLAGWDDEY
ncbi:MAG: hypothetical protein ILNGONEN_01507 [Syntrophorhabdaceae bacterium]|nr:hypothetical protein [Syntrophorhabdaceae bacterium]